MISEVFFTISMTISIIAIFAAIFLDYAGKNRKIF